MELFLPQLLFCIFTFPKMCDKIKPKKFKTEIHKLEKTIELCGKNIKYTLEYKSVKNINLRIKSDGTVYASANKRVPVSVVESFMQSKADFILNALEKYQNRTPKEQIRYFEDDEIKDVVTELCKKVYPYYEKLGIAYPQIKFRRMVSQWGNCHPKKGVLTFNTSLCFAPFACIEYVVFHEFTHFLVPNHSSRFYTELSKVYPDWKACRKRLKEINIR